MIAILERFLSRHDTHPGADDTWSPLADLATDTRHPGRHRTNDDPTVLLRRPVAALTTTGHYAVYDEHLGGLNPGPLEPARIHDELKGAAA